MDITIDVRTCSLCNYQCASTVSIERHCRAVHPGETIAFSIIAIPERALMESMSAELRNLAIQRWEIDSTVGHEFTCTKCDWTCTEKEQILHHIYTSEDHLDAWFTVSGVCPGVDSDDESDSEGEIDVV